MFSSTLRVISSLSGSLNDAQKFMQNFALAISGDTAAQNELKNAGGMMKPFADYIGSFANQQGQTTGFWDNMDQLGNIMMVNQLQELIKQVIAMLTQASKGIVQVIKDAVEDWKRSG